MVRDGESQGFLPYDPDLYFGVEKVEDILALEFEGFDVVVQSHDTHILSKDAAVNCCKVLAPHGCAVARVILEVKLAAFWIDEAVRA